MATVQFPTLGPGILSFGAQSSAKDFSAQVKSVSINPELKDGGGVELLNGNTTYESNETFGTLQADFYQDFSLDGLVAWTYTNAGKILPFTFVPLTSGTGFKVTGKCKIKPVVIGGDVKKANTSSLSFDLVEALPALTAK